MADQERTFSHLWTVHLTDWERGLICAIIGIPIEILTTWASTPNFQLSWVDFLKGALIGGLAYIGKNFVTGKNGNLLTNK